ncbi:MAG: DUF4912 domain-containing protein [Treponema sp.]|jgi:hypothetical protein|nr:DUF4912 domain-containing protein [Treponema sp.]
MDDCRFTWPYLESLATHELAALADKFGIDIPPGLERNFIIEELLDLEYLEDEAAEPAPRVLEEAYFLESVPLPKRYNITFITVLIRDPLWVFAFWEVKAQDKEAHEQAPDFAGYWLRARPDPAPADRDLSFIIPVGLRDNAWYLGFPPEGGRFRVELCVKRGGLLTVLAASKSFTLPRLFTPQGGAEAWSPLAALSGLDELPILRNEDRLSRLPREVS